MGTLGPRRPPEPNAACPQDPAGSAGTCTLDRHWSVPESHSNFRKGAACSQLRSYEELKVIVTSCHNPQLCY